MTTPMLTAIDEWLNYLTIDKSPYTVKQYGYHLRRLAAAADRPPNEWTRAQLLEHIAQLRQANNGDSAIKQIIGAYKNFFAFTCEEHSPAKTLRYPKIKHKAQRVLDAKSALELLTAFDTSTPKGKRDLAIVTLLIDSGLRAAEVCRLRLDKLDLERRRLYVIIKGGDEGRGIFSQSTANYLSQWLSIRPTFAKAECTTVFCGIGGNTRGKPMTTGGLRAVFREFAVKSGLPHFSPHDLRRTFATLAIRNGAPTRIVQKAGRWQDLLQVERYTEEITAEDFEQYSPIENLLDDDRR